MHPDTLIVADNKTLHAACWWLKRDDVHLLVDSDELTYGLRYPEDKSRYFATAADLKAEILKRLRENKSKGRTDANVMVYSPIPNWEEVEEELPKPMLSFRDTHMIIAYY